MESHLSFSPRFFLYTAGGIVGIFSDISLVVQGLILVVDSSLSQARKAL